MKSLLALLALAALAWWLHKHWSVQATTQEQLKAVMKKNAA